MDAMGAIRQQSTLPWRDIEAIVFSPVRNVMYFGLHVSDMSVDGGQFSSSLERRALSPAASRE
jgi:hypothetical protein